MEDVGEEVYIGFHRRSHRGEMQLSGTKLRIPDIRAMQDFFETYCYQEVGDLANEWPDKSSITINFVDVERFSRELSEALINYFPKVEPILKKALLENELLRASHDPDEMEKGLILRVRGIPGFMRKSIRDLNKKDVGRVVCFDGFARMVSDCEPKYTVIAWECLRCGHVTIVPQPTMHEQEPFAGCENETCGKRGPFIKDLTQCECVDFQRIQVQELPDATRGTKTRDIIVELDEELCNIIEPGDKITVTGLLLLNPRSDRNGTKTTNEKIIKALSVEKQEKGFDEMDLTPKDIEEILELSKDPEICEKIPQSIAPSIHGHGVIKEAAAMQLFTGVSKVMPDGMKLRGNSHMMLIGEPGIAKSQLLRYIVRLSPRGVYASGKTASAAGLTAAAVKDPLNDGRWTLEGGAAVLADNGLLAIDEIGQARDEDKSALHEVLEQQMVSVAKAGIVTPLRSRVSCLAAGNPKYGYFDPDESFSEQIEIEPALLSRFDLIFVLLDTPNPEQDEMISGHILNNHMVGGAIQNKNLSDNPVHSDAEIQEMIKSVSAPIGEELLKKYIAYARAHVFPVTSSDVLGYMQKFYLDIREMKVSQKCPVPVTARNVEALQRLSEARARMRLSDVVTREDVDHAKSIIIASLKDVGFDPETGMMDASIIQCGKSRSMREKIKELKNAIKANGEPDAVNQAMKNYGVSVEDTEKLISKLREQGDIYFTGVFYKVVEK